MSQEIINFLPDNNYEQLINLIDDISGEVDEKLKAIPVGKKRPRNYEETEEAIRLVARRAQLRTMSELLFGMAANDERETSLDLDNTQLLTGRSFMKPGYFEMRKDYEEDAARAGEIEGTNDLLGLLVPEYIPDAQHPELYFTPWKKNILRKRHFIQDNPDGSGTAILPTRLPNVNVTLYYPVYADFPLRILSLANSNPPRF